MTLRRKPRKARLSEVVFARESTAAMIEFVDGVSPGTHLELGTKIQSMTDAEILDRYNEVVEAMERARAEYRHVAVEIPVGKPQIRYSPLSDQWVPRGDVIRCLIDDTPAADGVTITIDEHELSLRELGRLLQTHAGWRMRITFVLDYELHANPPVDVREPDSEDDA